MPAAHIDAWRWHDSQADGDTRCCRNGNTFGAIHGYVDSDANGNRYGDRHSITYANGNDDRNAHANLDATGNVDARPVWRKRLGAGATRRGLRLVDYDHAADGARL